MMSWVYKMKNKLSKEEVSLAEVVPVCPKCHYILLVRNGEEPLYCPMCGRINKEVKNDKSRRASK